MIVEIGGNLRLRSEAGSYVLERKVVISDHHRAKAENVGSVRWDSVGYYGDLKTCANQLLLRHFKLLQDEAGPKAIRDVQDLVDAIAYGAELIAKACQEKKEEPA